jgi:protein phosphatase
MSVAEQPRVDVRVGSSTRVGGRDHNEDAVLVKQIGDGGDTFLLAVADGMGGHEGGEIASALAIETVQDHFNTAKADDDVALELKRAYRKANERVWAEGDGHDAVRHMGTTLVTAVLHGRNLTIANVGDSRAYLVRGSQVQQLTQDHSVVAEQVEKGELASGDDRKSAQRNMLTAAIGTTETLEKKLPAIYELSLLPEDRFLLCSDGFYDVIEQGEYAGQLTGDDPDTLSLALTSLAEQRGTTDNVSAVVMVVRPSRASEQRTELEGTIAESRPQGNPIVVAVIVLFLVLAIGALAFFFLL